MFKQSELRNNNRPLLRRLQRQIDAKQQTKPKDKKEIVTFGAMGFSNDEIDLDLDESKILNKTRLNLYDRRKGRWIKYLLLLL